jgi:hypothetical protein
MVLGQRLRHFSPFSTAIMSEHSPAHRWSLAALEGASTGFYVLRSQREVRIPLRMCLATRGAAAASSIERRGHRYLLGGRSPRVRKRELPIIDSKAVRI